MYTPERGRRQAQKGLTLIELILFIVVVAIALAGVLAVMNLTAARSSDPLVRKQALAIAEALLEEVELMPFTYCDPDDANVMTAVNPAGCASIVEAPGPEALPALETRYSTATPFDNVNDYNGFAMTGIRDISGNAIPALTGYNASVTVTPDALAGAGLSVPSSASLRVSVTVTGPGNESVTLEGYRTRSGPRTP